MDDDAVRAGCGLAGCILVPLVNITIGAFAFQYCLWNIFGKDIPWYADMICGLFLGEFAILGAIVCWIMALCGVETPLIK